jgi:hypothetical protein
MGMGTVVVVSALAAVRSQAELPSGPCRWRRAVRRRVRLVWAPCIVATTRPSPESSESLIKLVNRADYVKAESKPAGARWPRRLGANGNRGGTARRGRVYRA